MKIGRILGAIVGAVVGGARKPAPLVRTCTQCGAEMVAVGDKFLCSKYPAEHPHFGPDVARDPGPPKPERRPDDVI